MSFDQVVDRTGTFSFKWERYKGKDILPLWVADSEFKCAPAIIDALHKRVEHGVFGYHLPIEYEPANTAVVRWLNKQHDWQIKPEWIVWTASWFADVRLARLIPSPGAVCGRSLAIARSGDYIESRIV